MSKENFTDLTLRDTERHILCAVDASENSKRAVMYLASDDARFITGTSLAIDGGTTAGK